jgi:hypothetical protein
MTKMKHTVYVVEELLFDVDVQITTPFTLYSVDQTICENLH